MKISGFLNKPRLRTGALVTLLILTHLMIAGVQATHSHLHAPLDFQGEYGSLASPHPVEESDSQCSLCFLGSQYVAGMLSLQEIPTGSSFDAIALPAAAAPTSAFLPKGALPRAPPHTSFS
jgi:hypothetical protein